MQQTNLPSPDELKNKTTSERRAIGRALRSQVPRSSHGDWTPSAQRPDPVGLLEETNRTRIATLVPMRYGRMLTSPFAFLRGSAVIMAADLAQTPSTGIQVQLCGDAHLSNFGTYATPERNQVFDVNDFDESLPGPWEWDVKRLAASIAVAGLQNRFSAPVIKQAVLHCLLTYRERMWAFGDMSHLDVWYSSVDAQSILKQVGRVNRPFVTHELEAAYRHTDSKVFPQWTTRSNNQYVIKDNPPLITHPDAKERADFIRALSEGYEASLADERRTLFKRYQIADLAEKVVGVGSVGTHCAIVLLLGSAEGDPLFLQIKEARPSVLERYLSPSVYTNQAQRVVNGQRMMQATSDIFLGWTSSESIDYYVRQLRDRKGTPTIEQLSENDFTLYTGLCGWTLARAHARSGDPALLSGYLGKSNQFDRAIAAFALAYTDQVERDYTTLADASRAGRIKAEIPQ